MSKGDGKYDPKTEKKISFKSSVETIEVEPRGWI